MDVMENQIVRLMIITYPLFSMKYIATLDDEFFVIFLVVISCSISFFLPRNKWIFRYMLPMVFLYYLARSDDEELWNKKERYENISKNDSAQFLWPLICMTCFNEFRNLFTILLDNVRTRISFIPVIRVIFFTLYCLFHSVLFVYIIYVCGQAIFTFGAYYLLHINSTRSPIAIEVNPMENMMKSTCDLQSTNIRSSIYHLHEMDHNGSREIIGYSAYVNNLSNRKFNILRAQYQRVIGEDFIEEFNFEYLLSENIHLADSSFSVKFDKFKNSEWTIGGTVLKNDSYHHFTQIGLKFTLKIISLTEYHFDKDIIGWAITKRCSNGVLQTIKLKIALFVILPTPIEIHFVHVPRGHIMYVNKLVFYMLSNLSDASVIQHVSSIALNNDTFNDISNICSYPLYKFKGCGPMIHWLYNKTKVQSFGGQELNSVNLHLTVTDGLIGLRSLSCVCDRAYGKHTFTILRTLYNKSSKRYYLMEIQLPYTLIVLPKGITHFAASKYNVLKQDFKEIIQSDNTDWRRPWRYFVDDEDFYYYIIYKGEYFALFIFQAENIILVILTIKLYNRIFIRPVSKLFLVCRLPEAKEASNVLNLSQFGNDRQDFLYDAMIVSTEVDREFAVRTLIPCLENIGLTIFFPEIDIPGGQPDISAYANAVASSKFFVVVGTNDFVEDKWNNEYVLQNLILPRIYELKNHDHHIFIITHHPYEIPRPLRWNRDITEIKLPEATDEETNKATIVKHVTLIRQRMQLAIQCDNIRQYSISSGHS